MNSPCADPSVLKTKNSQCHSLMSPSLRERLKKCGRYHPPSTTSCSNTPPSATSIASPDSLPVKDSGGSVLKNEAFTIGEDHAETPKRRSPGPLNDTNTDTAKRRKLDYSKKFGVKISNIDDQTNVDLSPALSIMAVDVSLDVLRDDERQVNDAISPCSNTEHLQHDDGALSCPDEEGNDMPTENSTPDEKYVKLNDLKMRMEKELKVKEELMRQLNMVKMYREKNNLTELQTLIDRWRDVSQKALVDLCDLHPPPRPSLTELINHLQIDHELIHYVADDETFS